MVVAEPEKVIMLTFDEANHEYRVDGELVPSVTQILRPLYSFDAISPDVLERKRQIGTAVHRAAELLWNDDLDETTLAPEITGYLEAWRRFLADSQFTAIDFERRVYSPRWKYAGTFDALGEIGGKPALIDLKTGEFHPAMALQTSAYATALGKVVARYSLHLRSNGNYSLVSHDDKSDFNIFLACLAIYKWKEKFK